MLGFPPCYHTTSQSLHLAKCGGACTVFSAIKCVIHLGCGCPGAAGSNTLVLRLIVCCSCSRVVALGFVLSLHSSYTLLFSLHSTSCCPPSAHLSLPSLDIFHYHVDTTVNSVPSKELLLSYVSA